MKIENGKFYRTRDGRKVGPMSPCDSRGRFFEFDGKIWIADGSFNLNAESQSQHDLIAEWEDNEHIERTKRMIEVMQAYVDGKDIERVLKKDIEVIGKGEAEWNWQVFEYRIAEAKTHDSINWDHVAPEFKYMARDAWGDVWLYKDKPEIIDDIWTDRNMEHAGALAYASYRRGTADWKDSLVIRPGYE